MASNEVQLQPYTLHLSSAYACLGRRMDRLYGVVVKGRLVTYRMVFFPG